MALLDLAQRYMPRDFGELRDSRTPVTFEVSPPQRFGPYTLIRHLANGGMAQLYLARVADGDANDLFVLKRMRPELAQNATVVRMFLDEATIGAALDHPNIARTADVGRADGEFYFAMEFLRGANARQILQQLERNRRALSIECALHIAVSACAALDHAHNLCDEDGAPLHIVHRDISPQNLFVTYQGVPKVLDFGIATAALRLAETRIGAIKGKIPYMSPEQCQSHPLDCRSDIFSLCIVLWELTTGMRLFRGTNDLQLMNAVADGEARRPSSVRPDYPPELEQIVMCGLNRNPSERYQTAAQLQRDLEDFAARSDLHVSHEPLSQLMSSQFPEAAGIDELGDCSARAPSLSDSGDRHEVECVVVIAGAPVPPPDHPTDDGPTETVKTRALDDRPPVLLLLVAYVVVVVLMVLWSTP